MTGTLDLRGVECPLNYVKARLALEPLSPGTELDVLLDAGEPVRNVPRSLADDGNTVVALDEQPDGYYRLRVRKQTP
ncbi:MAG: sulfurtransferase TusA family protein [Coriobacteriia bacterium]|nr:sulfurtransferase TusA family protein [Coriobacteriia bacterium]